MEPIFRGTTPLFIVRLNGTGINVSDIENVVLSIVWRTGKTKMYLADFTLNEEENTIYHHFTQEETLAMRAGEMVYFEMDILANGERYRAVSERHDVRNTAHAEVLNG